MLSKVLFSAFVAVFVAQVALADPSFCPNPSDANQLVYKQNVLEEAPEFGRLEKDYYIPPLESEITCIIFSGSLTGSVASVGLTENGIKVRVVSEIRQGLDAVLEVYSNEVV